MNESNSTSPEISKAERDADSRVDMWAALALIAVAWSVAIFWVSGQ